MNGHILPKGDIQLYLHSTLPFQTLKKLLSNESYSFYCRVMIHYKWADFRLAAEQCPLARSFFLRKYLFFIELSGVS